MSAMQSVKKKKSDQQAGLTNCVNLRYQLCLLAYIYLSVE